MPDPAHRLLVFTDLDGTLLDHHTYSFDPARPVLARLRDVGAVLVLTSSKTEPEMRALRAELGNDAPFVVENGSVVCMPGQQPERVVHGAPYGEIRALLGTLRRREGYDFVGFGDLDAAGVAELTELSVPAAALAKQRAGTEPLVWRDSDEALGRFEAEVRAAGLTLTRGGRFVHVMGDTDKGRAVPFLRAHYQARFPGTRWTTVGLGDSHNDLPLLGAVDIAVIIRKPTGSWLALERPGRERTVYRSELPGPAGWAATLTTILKETHHG